MNAASVTTQFVSPSPVLRDAQLPSDLVIRGLSKTYTTGGGELPILKGVSLSMTRGESLAITGPSGSGKSTLLYLLGTLEQPTSGRFLLDGVDPFTLRPAQQAEFRNRQIGFVFQDHHLLPQCTLWENVLLPALPQPGGAKQADADRARELLVRVGLEQRMNHFPAQVSGGERQRAAVCRALLNRPLLLLADEPTGNLDQHSADQVGTLLLDLNREFSTLLICVTHSEALAHRFPQRVELMDGQLQAR